ncbi:MAG: helix-turn-helix domain-containing protein [Candidatus Dormibacteraceae bacterium]
MATAQRAHLLVLLAQGAESFGFRGDRWTAPRVTALITREFGVTCHPTHVSRLLRQIERSSPKPITRATQRDEGAIAARTSERWPALKKGPSRRSSDRRG